MVSPTVKSNRLQTGSDFGPLPAANGSASELSLASFASHPIIGIVFICTGCPTVRAFEDRLMALQADRASAGLQLVAINSNNPYLSPTDSLSDMRARARARGYNFPYLKDLDGAVARRFGAICTPHAFVLNAVREVAYQGRIDDQRAPERVTSRDLETAVDDLLAGRSVCVPRTEPFGCAIVW